MFVFCLIVFDLCKFDIIGCLLGCCLRLWFSCDSVIIGMLSFFVRFFSDCEIFEILVVWFLFCDEFDISCRQLMMIRLSLLYCCVRCCVCECNFIGFRLFVLLMKSCVLFIFCIVCVSFGQFLFVRWFVCIWCWLSWLIELSICIMSWVFGIFIENIVIGNLYLIVMYLLMFIENVVLFIDGCFVMMISLLLCILDVIWLRLMKLVGVLVMLFGFVVWYSVLMCLIICVSSGLILRKFWLLCVFFLVIENIFDLVLLSSWWIFLFCGLNVLVEILLVIDMSWCSIVWLCMIFVQWWMFVVFGVFCVSVFRYVSLLILLVLLDVVSVLYMVMMLVGCVDVIRWLMCLQMIWWLQWQKLFCDRKLVIWFYVVLLSNRLLSIDCLVLIECGGIFSDLIWGFCGVFMGWDYCEQMVVVLLLFVCDWVIKKVGFGCLGVCFCLDGGSCLVSLYMFMCGC